jgi:hypothetical protein
MAEKFNAGGYLPPVASVVPALAFRAIGQPDLPEQWIPLTTGRQKSASDLLQACIIDCRQSDGSKLRLFGELRTEGDGTMTFTPDRPSYLLMPDQHGGENGDK